MATSVRVSEQDLLDALAASIQGHAPADAKTTSELVDETGIARTTLVEALRALHKQGRLVPHQVKRMGFDGKLKPVPAYTILPPPKAAKKKAKR